MMAELVVTSFRNVAMIQEPAEVWGAEEGQEDDAFFGSSPERMCALC